jgi:hypothetical protein
MSFNEFEVVTRLSPVETPTPWTRGPGSKKKRCWRNSFILFSNSTAVELTFPTEAARDEWLETWHPLAQHVANHEHQTLSFEACISDRNPLIVLVQGLFRYSPSNFPTVFAVQGEAVGTHPPSHSEWTKLLRNKHRLCVRYIIMMEFV